MGNALRWAGLCALACAVGQQAHAQTVSGRFYFLVENRDTRAVEQRGQTESAGIAFSNLILRSNTNYRVYLLEASTLRVADVSFRTPENGQSFTLPTFFLRTAPPHGAQDDLLHNLGEYIVGTDPLSVDSDQDGTSDGAEILAGQDPLSGIGSPTGLVNSLALGGDVADLEGQNEVLAVALRGSKVVLINAFSGLQPRVIGEYRTVGEALGVALSGDFVALADGAQGLRIVDFSDPPNPTLRSTTSALMLQGEARCVAAAANVAYVGLSTGRVVSIDMVGGQVLERLNLNDSAVVALEFERDALIALTASNTYHAIELGSGTLTVLDTIQPQQFGSVRALTAGGGLAYGISDRTQAIDTSDPSNLAVLSLDANPVAGLDVRDTALNGSGVGLQVIRPSLSVLGVDRVSLFDLSDPTNFLLINEFALPAPPTTVSVFNGLAYAGDQSGGLQVVNYLPSDTAGIAPTISLTSNFGLSSIEEGKLARITADVTDDVQPRAVEFYLDGQLSETDNAFPFAFRFVSPTLSQTSQFTLRARVFDTGGNFTWTQEFTVTVTADSTGPIVRTVVPAPGSVLPQVATVAAQLSEPVDPATLSQASFTLTEAGPNQTLGDGDDVAVSTGTLEARPEVPGVFMTFGSSLPAGIYRATLTTALLDAGGNSLASAETWDFTVYGGSEADTDSDGVPDLLELALGFDPNLTDSDNDGTPDGDEDGPDGDGLTILQELLYGLDPQSLDTDMDGVPDPETDLDFDRAFLITEIQFGTSPFDHDTDDDGYDDNTEIVSSSVPTDPLSTPVRDLVAGVAVQNQARPNDVLVGVAILNQATPDAVAGSTSAKPTSVENQAP